MLKKPHNRFYIKTGKTYTYSLWARCLPPDPEYRPFPEGGFLKRLFRKQNVTGKYPFFTLSVRGAGSKSFLLDSTWRKYDFTVDLRHHDDERMPKLRSCGISNLSIQGRFLKLSIITIGNCPDWHIGAKKPA